MKEDKFMAKCPAINDRIRAFAAENAGNSKVEYVSVTPYFGAQPSLCYLNVSLAASTFGGEPVLGYTIWDTAGLYLSAEHHCVLRMPQGLVDVTPDPQKRKQVLFVPTEEKLTTDNLMRIRRRNRERRLFCVLVKSGLVERAVDILHVSSHRYADQGSHYTLQGLPVPLSVHQEYEEASCRSTVLLDRHVRRERQRELCKATRRKAKASRRVRQQGRG